MNLPGLEDLMRQAQFFAQQMAQVKEELASLSVEGSAGGGMVVVRADGRGIVQQVKIEPQVINPKESEMLEDLITAAVNQALKAAKDLGAEKTRGLTGGMTIPGLESLFNG